MKQEQSLGTETRCGKNATKHREHTDQANPVILSELQSRVTKHREHTDQSTLCFLATTDDDVSGGVTVTYVFPTAMNATLFLVSGLTSLRGVGAAAGVPRREPGVC